MKNTLSDLLHEISTKLDYPKTNIVIQLPKNTDHGDFATNLPLQLGKILGEILLLFPKFGVVVRPRNNPEELSGDT